MALLDEIRDCLFFQSKFRPHFGRLSRQDFPALGSSSGQHFLATIGTHSFSKAMIIFLFPVAGLKSSFHEILDIRLHNFKNLPNLVFFRILTISLFRFSDC